MRKIRFFVSYILLMAFATAMVNDAFASSNPHVKHNEELSVLSHEADGALADKTLHNLNDKSSSSEDCSDPCHTGHCHFGHCFFLSTKLADNYSNPLLSKERSLFSKTFVDGPTLEGLLRPPQYI